MYKEYGIIYMIRIERTAKQEQEDPHLMEGVESKFKNRK